MFAVRSGSVQDSDTLIALELHSNELMTDNVPCYVRTHLLEYSLVIASVVSIGHLSTTALAASTLGSMTASVSGYSIVQGFTSTLDTMLPSAWTSSQPQLVGLWSQRMGMSPSARPGSSPLKPKKLTLS